MIPKVNRVDRKSIDQIFKTGRFVNSTNLTFKFLKSPTLNSYRISFVAPKSVAKLAVKRNLLRRRGYNALKKINTTPFGIIGIFVFKNSLVSISELENEIKTIFSKIN